MTSARIVMLLLVAAAIAAWVVLSGPRTGSPPTIAELQQRGRLQPAPRPTDTQADTHVFPVPGPGGGTVSASFYGLNRLPTSGDDLCAALRAELDTNPPTLDRDLLGLAPEQVERIRAEATEAIRMSSNQQWRAGCLTDARDARPRLSGSERAVQTIALAHALESYRRQSTAVDEARIALTIRWSIARMKEMQTVQQLRGFLPLACVVRPGSHSGPLFERRFAADCERLQAAICDTAAHGPCRVEALIRASAEYAILGRLENDEQHFRDMSAVLEEVEPLARGVRHLETRMRLLDDIVRSLGYAGEAGRDRSLLKRAAEVAARNLTELQPGPDRFTQTVYADALDSVATTLSRLAPGELDRIEATRRAIDALEGAIAFRLSVTPDDPSFASYVSLSSSQRELFELTRERDLIDRAVDNARRSLAILSAQPGRGSAHDNMLHFVRARLGQALVWRSRYAEGLEPRERQAEFAEAKELLETAEAVFRSMNAQAYLRFITAAQRLLPDEMKTR